MKLCLAHRRMPSTEEALQKPWMAKGTTHEWMSGGELADSRPDAVLKTCIA